jgi:hypothetical protein
VVGANNAKACCFGLVDSHAHGLMQDQHASLVVAIDEG